MAKQKANVSTIYLGAVGGANPPTTPGKMLNKKNPQVTLKNATDDVTTDDSTGPEKMTVYAGLIDGCKVVQVVDTTDPTYDFLRLRLEDGAAFLFCWRPDGDGTPKRQGVCQAIVTDRAENRDPQKVATCEWTIDATGGTTWSNQ